MLGSYGLRTYIWNNRLKSVLLLLGFPFLLLLICLGFALVISAWSNPDVGEGIMYAFALVPSLIPVAVGGALLWFIVAWFANQTIVDALTGARQVEREKEQRLYNLLENLCISRGITTPRLRIVESPALNAYASGVRKNQYTITVTRGLIDALDDAELEAVLAHELTHIKNRDVQLLVVAAVFVGIISLVGDVLIRSPRFIFRGGSGRSRGGSSSGGGGGGSRGSSKGGGGGAIILMLIAVAVFLIARVLAIALRMAMSRKREFMADAGAVELTKNPDAMIGALRKISGRSELPAPEQIRSMFIDHPRPSRFWTLFATHPSIEDRVAALVRYGGGREAIATGPVARAELPRPEPPQFGKRTEPQPTPLAGTPVEPLAKPWGETRS